MSVRPSVRVLHFCLSPGDKQFVCPPGDKHFSHTGGGGTNKLFVPGGQTYPTHRGGGGDKQIVCPPGTNIFLSQVKFGPLLLDVSVAQW